MIKREVWYFQGVGPQNTPACLELMEKAVAAGFRHLVVASTTGDSRGPGRPAPAGQGRQPGGGGTLRGV